MTGKFRRYNPNTPDDSFDGVCIHAYACVNIFRRLDRTRTLASDKGISLPQLGLAYVLGQPLPIFALMVTRTPAEFVENLPAPAIQLTPAELACDCAGRPNKNASRLKSLLTCVPGRIRSADFFLRKNAVRAPQRATHF